MKIIGTTEEVKENIKDAFHLWPIIIQEDCDGLYDIEIKDDIPYILRYNSPKIKITIGSTDIEFNNNEFVSLNIM